MRETIFQAESWTPELSDPETLVECVEHHVHDRVSSLQSDVEVCMFDQSRLAPFPALLYCFSTIDLLGALAGGEAGKDAPTTRLASEFMRTYMGYKDDQVRLLQGQFRHKLVHLAEPKPIVRDGDRFIAWEIWCEENGCHLQLQPLKKERPAEYGPSQGPKWSCRCTHLFRVSIPRFVSEIKDSAVGNGGYLQALAKNANLQDKARKALGEIYAP